MYDKAPSSVGGPPFLSKQVNFRGWMLSLWLQSPPLYSIVAPVGRSRHGSTPSCSSHDSPSFLLLLFASLQSTSMTRTQASVGAPVGAGDGGDDGDSLGLAVGLLLGLKLGSVLGPKLGCALGSALGLELGEGVGSSVGDWLGSEEGETVGNGVPSSNS